MKRSSLAALLVLAPLALGAQDRVLVRGTVRDTTGKPIPDAAILLKPGDRHARTAADGGFGFDSLRTGFYFYEIRRLGFSPSSGRIRITRDTTLDLRVTPRPRMLDTIVVTDKCSRVQFTGFLCRRSKGNGLFLTEADILAKNPQYLADVLRDVDGIRIAPAIGRYGQTRIPYVSPARCLVELVDGRVAVANRAPGVAARSGVGGRSTSRVTPRQSAIHELIRPEELMGVEVYPPGSRVPEEFAISSFNNETCILVNYWTTATVIPRPPAK